MLSTSTLIFFFFNDTATTEIYTLSLHDALPIWNPAIGRPRNASKGGENLRRRGFGPGHGLTDRPKPKIVRSTPSPPETCRPDRKSTRLNSSHANISYAVFCLKKKKKKPNHINHE